jgi:hypothetical protein
MASIPIHFLTKTPESVSWKSKSEADIEMEYVVLLVVERVG